MSTLLLICVFGVSASSPGTAKVHPLTRAESSRYSALEQSIDDSCEECSDAYEARRKALEHSMCRKSFGAAPDLSWVESRAIKAVRS